MYMQNSKSSICHHLRKSVIVLWQLEDYFDITRVYQC